MTSVWASPGVSHQVATRRPQLFPVHRTLEPVRAGRARQRNFSFKWSSPASHRVVHSRPGSRQQPCPTLSTGQIPFALTPLWTRAIVLATRDPRRDKGSRSVRGRQSANPRITGGLVSHDQGKRLAAGLVGHRGSLSGQQTGSRSLTQRWGGGRVRRDQRPDRPAGQADVGLGHERILIRVLPAGSFPQDRPCDLRERRTAGDRCEPLGSDGMWTKRGPIRAAPCCRLGR